MSFILDALRKSEYERERRALPGLVEAPVARAGRPTLAWLLGGIGLLLAVNAVILGIVLLRPAAPGPATAAVPAPAAPVAATPAATPTPRTPLVDPGRIRPLAAEAGESTPEVPEPPPVVHAAPETPSAEPAAAPVAPRYGVPVRAEPPAAGPRPPTLRQLPAATAAALPPLNIDLHVYSPVAAQRFAIINGQKVHEGSTLREGLAVEQITTDGVVLNHQGTRFTLTRE